MATYRIWLSPRSKMGGRARPDYHVDIEATDREAAVRKANSSPFWTGEIQKIRPETKYGDRKKRRPSKAAIAARARARQTRWGSRHRDPRTGRFA